MIFTNKQKPIQYINKIPFLIHAIIKIEKVQDPNDVKQWLGCSTAFQNAKQGVYYFCNEIPNIEFEEVSDKEPIVENVVDTTDEKEPTVKSKKKKKKKEKNE